MPARNKVAPTKRIKKSRRKYTVSPNRRLVHSKIAIQRPELIIVSAETPKDMVNIVRPAVIVKQKSLSASAARFTKAVKEIADDTVNILRTSKETIDLSSDSKQIKIPVIKEEFSTEKISAVEEVLIEKRWVEKKTNLEVPVGYEQLFVNNEELKFGVGDTLSHIKNKILEIIPIELEKQAGGKDTWVPLFGSQTDMEKTIPLYAEDIIISKRKVKIGEIVIRKREITKEEKIDIDLVTEHVTVKNTGKVDE